MRCLVGIPTLNGPDRLRRALVSIFDCTKRSDDIKILVVDDGSTEENLRANKSIARQYDVELLMSERSGIAASWNRLTRHAESNSVVLLNDDIEVAPDWLDVLLYSVEENACAGMVSLNCHVGVTKAQVPQSPRVDYHEARLLGGGTLLSSGGAIFAFRREAYNKVDGFDGRYFVFYEEVDFGVALRRKGYYNFVASYPLVYHMGGATNSDMKNLDAAAHLMRSRTQFVEKWNATPEQLRRELMGDPPHPALREWNSQIKFLRD